MTYNVLLSSLNVECRANSVQCGQIFHYLLLNNHRIVNDEFKADFIIMNTCGFLNWYEQSCERVIQNFINLKKKVKLIVIGCLTKINRDIIAKYHDVIIIDDLNDLDEYFFTREKFQQRNIYFNNKIFRYLNSSVKIERVKSKNVYVLLINFFDKILTRANISSFPFNKIIEREIRKGKFFVKIGEGCVGNCSYCIIKKAKNRIISRKIDDILIDIKNNIDEQKEKNIVLIADDCGSYGIDIGTNIMELLFQIGNHFPSLGIDIYYLYPKWIEKIGNKLLNVFKRVKINSINIPIQSGSLKVLKSMNRSYNLEKIFQFINMLKKISPETMVFTHYLVGFPGEGFKDFLKTISTVPYFHNFYPFAYSSREGTKSNEFPNEIPNIMKRIRVTIILIMLYMNFARIILRNIIRRRK